VSPCPLVLPLHGLLGSLSHRFVCRVMHGEHVLFFMWASPDKSETLCVSLSIIVITDRCQGGIADAGG